MSLLAFKMWEPVRQSRMAEHRFYIEQARRRLLSQFGNLEAEADKATEEHLARISRFFDPDSHDEADFYQSAFDKGIEFYLLLSNMQVQTRLSVIAGMYHEWDKKLRDWVVGELRSWHPGKNVLKSVWKADVSSIFDLFFAFGFDVKAVAGYARLDAMRLVVNVFKHGNGISLDELNDKYPDHIPDPLGSKGEHRAHLDHTNMKVTDEHFEQFSLAVLEFWRAIPEEMRIKQEAVEVPKWFEKAYLMDKAEQDSANSAVQRSG